MGRTENIFNWRCEKGEEAIKDFINDRQSEDLFLDFKRPADNGSKKRLHQNNRQNMAKAISGSHKDLFYGHVFAAKSC